MAQTTLEPGTSSPEVQQFQKRLAKFGYKVPTDGSFDDATLAAANDLSDRIGYKASVKSVDAGFLAALDKFEKRKFYRITIKGKDFVVDEEQREKLRKAFAPQAEAAVAPFVSLAREAEGYWKAHSDARKEHWFWAEVVDVYASATFPTAQQMAAAVAAAENLRGKAKALALTPAEMEREVARIRTAFKAMSDYRDKMFSGGEDLIKNLEALRDGCVLTLEISAALATGGASVEAQIALSMAVAGYDQALKEVDTASKTSNYSIQQGVGNVAFSAGVDGVAGMILKGAKGKAVLDAVEKAALKEGSGVLKTYIVKGIRGGGEKMIEDGIKAVPGLADGSKKLTFEEIVKEATKSFLTGMAVGALGDVAEKWGKGASKNFNAKDFEAFGKNVKLDKAGEEAVKKVIEKVSGGVTEKVLSGWDPKKDPKKADEEIRKQILANREVQAAAQKASKKK